MVIYRKRDAPPHLKKIVSLFPETALIPVDSCGLPLYNVIETFAQTLSKTFSSEA